ncbi:conserved hypothetical protein [Rippkaea orientalis PCC 8801]|uniref:DUF4126 domain-containing protein n=1 Tax=Rippkaea orientalis (strain PCC 8801 / RF-1) TaxID=41431 RepID=B7K412_RIPO1|nr:DUF4126 domain-containing protein [Rippkaea orientalis]ACK66552.1 conserved hypothetical protein [Rippkaea orientalis PCC 8801]
MIIGILAVLSASAAAGMRIALPLLIIGLLHSNLWSEVPLLSKIPPPVLLGVLTSWSLFELFGSKKLLGQRVLQLIELVFSPFVGGLLAVTVVKMGNFAMEPLWLIGVIGGVLALVLKLVQVGWFFRLRGIPFWVVCLEDLICVLLVFFAVEAPENGGLIALMLLWLAIRSSTAWQQWYSKSQKKE